jgi:serine/threonine protein phosphatase 1
VDLLKNLFKQRKDIDIPEPEVDTADTEFVAIGDIHGCKKSLDALLEQLSPYTDRHFVFIGDYIDRGPDSQDSVQRIINFSKDHKCTILRGNHEQMLLDAFETKSKANWMHNGGTETLRSYNEAGNKMDLPYQHHHFYRNTKLYLNSKDYFFVHAGLDPDTSIAEALYHNYTEQFLWEREHLNQKKNRFEKKIVFGHTPMHEPLNERNMIGIDTGCVYNKLGYGKLTAILLPEEKFIIQECLDDVKNM